MGSPRSGWQRGCSEGECRQCLAMGMWPSLLRFHDRGGWALFELPSPLRQVTRPEAGVLTRQGALTGFSASIGGVGVVLITKLCALALGPISHISGRWDAPGCSSTRGWDTSSTSRLVPAPCPHHGETLPLGDQHISSSPLASRPPPLGWTTGVPPDPSRTRLPCPSLPAGRNRRGLSRPKVNIGFSGAVAGTRQRTCLSPPAAQKGLS